MRGFLLALSLVLGLTATAVAEDVVLSTGEVLRGTVVARGSAIVVVDHPVLGRLEIPAGAVVSVGPTPETAVPAVAPSTPPPAPEPPAPWKWKAEFGASGTDGNTNTSDLHAAITGVLKDDARKLRLGAGWSRGESNGEETKNQSYVEATHDWKIADSRWFPFVTARMEWDAFQDYDRRLSVGAGAGYRAVETDTLDLELRTGLIGTREWGSLDETWRLEGLLGAEAEWRMSDTQELEAATTYYADLEESGEYRLVSRAAWSIQLDNAENLRLKIGIEHEVDSHRASPFEKVDVRYFAAILYEF